MPAPLITANASLSCPHGGTVSIIPKGGATISGVPVALATDSFPISGCPFQIPIGVGTVPHPCVLVQWIDAGQAASVGGAPVLTLASVGLCLAADGVPQGPVIKSTTQTAVSAA